MEPKIFFKDTDGVAIYKTDIKGWVDRNGRYWGSDERMARWSGSTHNKCEVCGHIFEKTWAKCPLCRRSEEMQKYQSLPIVDWDGKTPVYCDERYFDDKESLDEYCFENSIQPSSLELYMCEPQMAQTIDLGDIYEDMFAEDQSINDFPLLKEQCDKLNKWIIDNPTILSWIPIDKRPKVEDFTEEDYEMNKI